MEIEQIPIWLNILSFFSVPFLALCGVLWWLYRRDRKELRKEQDEQRELLGKKASKDYVSAVESRVVRALETHRVHIDARFEQLIGEVRRNG